MTITSTDFSINGSGDLRGIAGTEVYSVLELHQWLQDLADNAAPSADDNISILGSNPSELAGKRNASRPMALTLLNGINLNDATAQRFQFGSVEQSAGDVLYTGLKSIGTIVAASPIYIIQNAAKVTSWWGAGHIQILLKAKTGGALIDSGNATVFSRKYGQTYSHFDVNLAAGGEQSAALSTSLDTNVDVATITPAVAAGYFSTAIGGTATPGTQKITLAFGDTSQDLGGGAGSKLHKGTITLDGSITLSQAYQALMWACSESSTITINSLLGYRYRLLNAAYAENAAAPFGTFAGGKWFVAQGYWLTGVQSGDSKNYQLVSHDGTIETPPTSITVSVGGVVSGDYVLVARDDGAGDILDAEYTVTAAAAATSVAITGLKVDTPATGVIRINGTRHTYTGKAGTTLSGLSPAVPGGGYSAAPAFVPLVDDVASGVSISSDAFQFSSNFTCRYRVRNGGGSPIVPFESTLAVTSNGGSGTAVRNADA